MEVNVEEEINFERDVKPYCEIKAPLNFVAMLAKNKTKSANQQKKWLCNIYSLNMDDSCRYK